MVKKISILVAVLFTLTLAGCSLATDSALVGKWDWKVLGTTAATYEFTADGTFSTITSAVTVKYKYTATGGTGKYWLEGAESAKVDLSYKITNNVLDLTIAGVTISGLVKQ